VSYSIEFEGHEDVIDLDAIKRRLASHTLLEWEVVAFRKDVADLVVEVERLRGLLPAEDEHVDLVRRAHEDACRFGKRLVLGNVALVLLLVAFGIATTKC
jgi:hypothetical protein